MTSTRAGFELESVTYQQDSETYRFEYDQDTTPASMAVVTALADVVDASPTEREPLHDTVDTDALDAVVRVRHPTNGDVHVTFSFEGYAITVHSYGIVEVVPLQVHERSGDPNTEATHR